jgi:hypothetical protein
VPHLSPSSDPEETADLLDEEEIGSFLTLFPLFTMDLVLSFSAEDDSVLLFFLLLLSESRTK